VFVPAVAAVMCSQQHTRSSHKYRDASPVQSRPAAEAFIVAHIRALWSVTERVLIESLSTSLLTAAGSATATVSAHDVAVRHHGKMHWSPDQDESVSGRGRRNADGCSK